MASRSSPSWAALPAELLQHTFGFLSNEDRLPMLDVCSSWCGALLAAPALVPTAVLTGVNVSALLQQAATLRLRITQLRLEDLGVRADKAGLKVLATLAVLPPLCFERLEHLDLAEWCSGPVLAALSRFKRLHTLLISGNGADIDWQGRGAAAVASKLRQLTLDCQGPHCPHAYEEEDDVELFDSDFPTSILSRSAAQSVLAATALSSLELVLDWTDDVAALCRGLPALRSLSLEVSRVRHGHMEAAVSMLHALTGLTGIRLGFSVWPAGHSCQLTWEGDMFDVPSLGGLAQLIELRLHAVILPPDWRQLSNLQRLSWNDIWHREGGEADGVYHISRGWHRDPLTALTALTALELGLVFEFDVELVASLPRLCTLHVPGKPPACISEMVRLRPDVEISLCAMPVVPGWPGA